MRRCRAVVLGPGHDRREAARRVHREPLRDEGEAYANKLRETHAAEAAIAQAVSTLRAAFTAS
jgi:hypothetical protein